MGDILHDFMERGSELLFGVLGLILIAPILIFLFRSGYFRFL